MDSFTGTPVDFQYINGNLVRNAGQSLAIYRFDISLTKAIRIPKLNSASLELKMDVFNLFNHPGFIFNNSFDALNLLLLPALTVNGAPNPNFNCTVSCLNPFTGLYLGANGQPLTLANFQRATFNAAKNFNGTRWSGGRSDAAHHPVSDSLPLVVQALSEGQRNSPPFAPQTPTDC